MTKIYCKFKVTGSILLFLFIFSSSLLFFFPQANDYLSNGKFIENSEELKLSATYWAMTEVVSTESTDKSWNPTIAVDGTGNVHVTWGDYTNHSGSGTDLDIFYKRWNATISTWTTTEVVSTESTTNSEGLMIAVDGDGNVHVTWYDFTNYNSSGTDADIFYKRWNATSLTWTTTEVVSTESTGWSGRSSIAVDGAGNAHVTWDDSTNHSGSGTDLDIFYKQWNATSNTWTTTEVVSTESTLESGGPMIAVDSTGSAHVAWQDYTDYDSSGEDLDIFYKQMNATNGMWTMTEVISTESTSNSGRSTIAVDGTGNVHVTWGDYTDYGGSGTDADIFYKRWNTTSNTWTTTEVVSTESTLESGGPMIAVDSTGNAHVTWYDSTNYGGSRSDWDIFYKKWNINSNTWTTTEVVSTESTENSWNPSIAVDGVGYAHVTWYDYTNLDSSGGDIDVFYKRMNLLPEISINSPENKTYNAPMSGYYPAIYGFENDANGASPEGWVNQDGIDCTSQIINGLGGHNKTLQQVDGSNSDAAVLNHTFTSAQDHGTVEFFSSVSVITPWVRMWLDLNSPSGQEIWFTMGDSKIRYYNGSAWNDIIPSGLIPNKWYHFSIRWRNTGAPLYENLAEGEWKIFIDEIEYGNYDLIYDDNIMSINLESGVVSSGHITYWDAVGFDWENDYNIGDNLNEGLLLSFENTSALDWIGYSLDSQTIKTILGNTSISIPEDGVHTIQVFGYATIGVSCQSNVRYFSVDFESHSEQFIPGYNISLLIGITYVVSVILIKKRNKNKL